jgi:hypothetical protein
VIPAAALVGLYSAIEAEAGSEVATRSLRSAGQTASTVALEQLAFGEAGPAQLSESAFWTRLSAFFARRGWGDLTLDTSHPGVGLLEGSGWAESGDASPYTEGLLLGILSAVVGANIDVMRLPGTGQDEASARFAFGSEATIRSLRVRLRDTIDASAALKAL